jgi:sodium/potassium-transporting ATPase subunit alpha
LIVWGVVLEIALILLIDYTSWGNLIFGTAPIPRQVWLFIQQREIDEPVPRI